MLTRSPAREVDIPIVVTSRQLVAANIVRMTLGHAEGTGLPSWEPGAHIDLVLDDATIRQYSLCGSPADAEWTVMVLREEQGRGGSRHVHDRIEVGARLTARGPRNHFVLDVSPRYRFLAGGIGITPILPMVREADRRGAEWTLTYCGRSQASMAMLDELRRQYGKRITIHADDVDAQFDVAGFLADPKPGELLYTCGPTGLLNAVLDASRDWPGDAIRYERFAPLELSEDDNTEFEVELALTGTVLKVPADRSILDVVTESGVQVLSSCAEGTCGTCETAVISGEIDHRDAVLSAEEQEDGNVMMICVSRASSLRLVLDL